MASVLCSSILRPVDMSDAPAGTSLHRLSLASPIPCIACPARIAAVSACVFLIGVAGQDNHAVASEDKKIKPKLKEIKVTNPLAELNR